VRHQHWAGVMLHNHAHDILDGIHRLGSGQERAQDL